MHRRIAPPPGPPVLLSAEGQGTDGLQTGALTLPLILAAGGADGPAAPDWIQLTPRGALTARDGRRLSFDPEALVMAFTADGLQLPIDFQHEGEFVLTLGAKPARGWITRLEARAEGVFGRVEWLESGRAAVAAREYRYVSPTFWTAPDRVTATKLKAIALVTSPALGMPALASAANEGSTMLKELLAKLGLTENATPVEALAALDRVVTAAAQPDPKAYVPMAQHEATAAALAGAQATIQAAADAAATQRCTSLVDDAVKAGKIAPGARDHFVKLARADYDAAAATIAAMPVVLKPGAEEPGDKTVHAGTLSADEKAVAAALGLTDTAFLAARAAA